MFQFLTDRKIVVQSDRIFSRIIPQSSNAENSVPVNYRIYDKKEGKTNKGFSRMYDYFREMLLEVITWGLKPKMVTGDSWYSSVANLKFLRNQKLGFLFGVEKKALLNCNAVERSSVSFTRNCYLKKLIA